MKARYKLGELFDKNGDLSKRWYVGYYYLHPETGKYDLFQLWISQKLRTRKERVKKANELIEVINLKLKQGFDPYQQENYSFTNIQEAIEFIVKIKSTAARARTASTYRSFAKSYINWLIKRKLNKLPLEAFNSRYAQDYMDFVKVHKKANNRTYNNHLQQIRTFFNEFIKRDYINFNPFKKIEYLQEEEPQITAYTREELFILKEYLLIQSPELWLVCQFIFYCFIRPNELVQLRIKDIQLQNEKIVIPAAVSKNKRQQVVAIPKFFLASITEIGIENLHPDLYLFSNKLKPGMNKIAPTRLAERFKKVSIALGINKRLYDLKHTGAGMAIENGVNILDLKNQLRHHSLDQTNTYLNKFKNAPGEDLKSRFPEL